VRGLHALTLGDLLEENARRFPQRTAVVCAEERLTFPAFHQRARRCAAMLSDLGVAEGDRVAWFAQNCHRYLETFFACALLGAVAVPLNWRVTAAELEGLLDTTTPRLVLYQRRDVGDVADAARGDGGGSPWIAIDDPSSNGYDARRDAAASGPPHLDVDDAVPVLQMYTAAFTGRPRGALLTHRGLVAQNLAQIIALGLGAGDAYLCSGPFFHIATFMTASAHFHIGAKNVLLPRADGAEIARLIDAERITGALIMPPTITDVVAAAKTHGYRLTSLRVPPMPERPDNREWLEMTSRLPGVPAGYGQTEVHGLATVNLLALDGMGAQGVASPVALVRVLDPDGADVPPGEVGEIAVKGPLVMAGYAGEPAPPEQTGWRRCNDLGRREEDGTITFIGPRTELIKTGAENVYPVEVENALRAHPSVHDACVIGVPDPTWGQSVKAVVEPAEGATIDVDELIAFCRERIASYKKPRQVDVVTALPRTTTGAVDREAVRGRHGGGGAVGLGTASATQHR